VGNSSRCDQVLSTVKGLLGQFPSGGCWTDKDVEVAFLHVRRCALCKASLTDAEYSAFVSRVLLEKE
jgi:hypothetical protein